MNRLNSTNLRQIEGGRIVKQGDSARVTQDKCEPRMFLPCLVRLTWNLDGSIRP